MIKDSYQLSATGFQALHFEKNVGCHGVVLREAHIKG